MSHFHAIPRTLLIIALLVGVIGLACGASVPPPNAAPDIPPATPPPVGQLSGAANAETPQTPAAVTAEPATSPADSYNSTRIMYRIYRPLDTLSMASIEHDSRITIDALEEVEARGDSSQVPVIIESMRFMNTEAAFRQAGDTLGELTGQNFGTGWPMWMEWLGRNSAEFPPPEGYLEWKLALLEQISPRFNTFLRDADETSRIDLTELVWGGVPPDGIPDLQNPPNIPADEAHYYLGLDERVFGVSINGEHRAYPLRIVNAHEMANDVLGGEPIALAY